MTTIPPTEPRARHQRKREQPPLKYNNPLWALVAIAIVTVLAYKLYDRYYGHQQFFPKLERSILNR